MSSKRKPHCLKCGGLFKSHAVEVILGAPQWVCPPPMSRQQWIAKMAKVIAGDELLTGDDLVEMDQPWSWKPGRC